MPVQRKAGPLCWCRRSTPLPLWSSGAESPGSWLRNALGTSHRVSQGPTGGCGAAVSPGRSGRFRWFRHPGLCATARPSSSGSDRCASRRSVRSGWRRRRPRSPTPRRRSGCAAARTRRCGAHAGTIAATTIACRPRLHRSRCRPCHLRPRRSHRLPRLPQTGCGGR